MEIDPDTSSCGPAPTLDFLRDPTAKEVAIQLLNPERQWQMLWPSIVAWAGVWFASSLALRCVRGGMEEPRTHPASRGTEDSASSAGASIDEASPGPSEVS